MADVKLTVRLPEVLHAELIEYAKHDERSLNAVLIRLLREALERHKIYVDPIVGDVTISNERDADMLVERVADAIARKKGKKN